MIAWTNNDCWRTHIWFIILKLFIQSKEQAKEKSYKFNIIAHITNIFSHFLKQWMNLFNRITLFGQIRLIVLLGLAYWFYIVTNVYSGEHISITVIHSLVQWYGVTIRFSLTRYDIYANQTNRKYPKYQARHYSFRVNIAFVANWPQYIGTALYPIRLYNYSDVIMGAMVSQITSLTIVYSVVYSGEDQRKHQSSASLAFVRIMLTFDDVIMIPHYISDWYIAIFYAVK